MASIHNLPTPTIVRIKRCLTSESSESIIVSSKRKRVCEDEVNDPDPDICTAIFKKLATLKSGDSLEIETKKAVEKEVKHSWDLKENYKKGINSSAKDIIRKRSKSDVAAIRFKLICSKRNLDPSEITEEASPSKDVDFHLLDALKEKEEHLPSLAAPSSSQNTDIIACNDVPMESEKVEFVYDLYYTSLPFEISSWISNICEIQRYNALDYTKECSKESNDSNEDDDDDENEESNWRNDYPEEEEGDFFEDEDDYICKQMQKARINDSDESFDAEEYDESGDFDEDGNLVLYNKPSVSGSVFGWPKIKVVASPSSDYEVEDQ